jgi:hypothetical protein
MTAAIAAAVRPTTLGRAHRLSSADYHRMGKTGILGPELRTELIDGEIILEIQTRQRRFSAVRPGADQALGTEHAQPTRPGTGA